MAWHIPPLKKAKGTPLPILSPIKKWTILLMHHYEKFLGRPSFSDTVDGLVTQTKTPVQPLLSRYSALLLLH